MAWVGTRPYMCDESHWFAVAEHTRPARSCPVCGSRSVRYLGDGSVPIFVLQVDDVWGIAREDGKNEEVYPFRELSVPECVELGGNLETPWEAVEVLAEMALEARVPPA